MNTTEKLKETIVQAHLKGQIDAGIKEPSTYQAMCYYYELRQEDEQYIGGDAFICFECKNKIGWKYLCEKCSSMGQKMAGLKMLIEHCNGEISL